jgi:hypothetical protein
MDAQAKQNRIRLRKEWLRIKVENDVVYDLIARSGRSRGSWGFQLSDLRSFKPSDEPVTIYKSM